MHLFRTPVHFWWHQALINTFTLWDGAAPHHLATVQLTSDGFCSLGLNEAVLADDRDGAAQLETVTETSGVQGDSWIRTLIMAKCCKIE